jgi:hypothetical protein
MKWPPLRRHEWIVLVLLDLCAISTALWGVGILLGVGSGDLENLDGMIPLATGVGFLWYVSRPILKGRSPWKSR